MRTGFIGVGLMGHGMAKCLAEKGHALTVMGHRNRGPVDDLVKRGATEANSAAEAAKNFDLVFLRVTGSAAGEGAVARPSVPAPAPRAPSAPVALRADLKARGVPLADAPLGGTPAQAEEGKL